MPFSFSEEDIEDLADSEAILERGKRYHRTGRIKSLSTEGNRVKAKIIGNYGTYAITITFDQDGEIDDYSCTCPYDGSGCKHIVAVLYSLLDRQDNIQEIPQQGKTAGTSAKKKEFRWNITLDEITHEAHHDTMIRALELLEEEAVEIKVQRADVVRAKVYDGEEQDVTLQPVSSPWRKAGVFSYCSCRSGSSCAHVIGTQLKLLQLADEAAIPGDYKTILREQYRQEQFRDFTSKLDFAAKEKEALLRKYQLLFQFEKKGSFLSLALQKALILKNGSLGQPSRISPSFLEQPELRVSEHCRNALHLLIASLHSQGYLDRSSPIRKTDFDKPLDLDLLRSLRAFYQEEPEAFIGVQFPSERVQLEIQFQKQDAGQRYALQVLALLGNEKRLLQKKDIVLLGKESLWLGCSSSPRKLFLAEIDAQNPQLVRYLFQYLGIEITAALFKDFVEHYYVPLSAVGEVALPDQYGVKEEAIAPAPRLYLRDHGNSFCMELRFLYGNKEVSLQHQQDLVYRNEQNDIVRIRRDGENEKKYYELLLQSQVMRQDNIFLPSIDVYEWLADKTPELIVQGFEIFGQQELVNAQIIAKEPELRLEISSGIDWFDLHLDVEVEGEKIPLSLLLNALKNQERFIKLSDERRAVIPEKWLTKLSGVIGFLESDLKQETIKASPAQINIIESLLDIATKAKLDQKTQQFREKFSRFTEIRDTPLPQTLQGELRPYQKVGYDWLYFLQEFSFGGCLADEMGLGKTVQVLSMLLKEKELKEKELKEKEREKKGRGKKEKGKTTPLASLTPWTPSLVVVPTSLVFNWQQEVQKFAPSLSIYVHHGLERHDTLHRITRLNTDLVLTTYGTLKRDINFLKKMKFFYIILDESQNIKNPLTHIARAVYSLQSKYRLVLTGTPIENNSTDLWSQFAFLNPGLLGNMDYFQKAFAKKIDQNKDKEKAAALKSLINPFILLRKKETVAADLPDKQITTLYCDMSKDQREVYEFWKQKFRQDILASIQEKGFANSRMKILQGLTILREICNHPRLIDESYAGESGKFSLLMERIKEVVQEGHKVLVFSSFVKMLKVFKAYFDNNGIKYCYLDGSTTKRQHVVEEFQNKAEKQAFLISLKAGGLGLNLTAADYVFVVDPWWNPAAEMQAIDRAHRIGQKNKVFVYKAITKESVEEKILELQESKLDLVKNIITVEEGIFKKLTREDIEKMFG
ncbi:DEAD/DEAH box helicase [Candidatus Woesearchaeota archaeon]|nr:DEAD/DEAH box helicase [Candidatus Woesearchaeota archaeon]